MATARCLALLMLLAYTGTVNAGLGGFNAAAYVRPKKSSSGNSGREASNSQQQPGDRRGLLQFSGGINGAAYEHNGKSHSLIGPGPDSGRRLLAGVGHAMVQPETHSENGDWRSIQNVAERRLLTNPGGFNGAAYVHKYASGPSSMGRRILQQDPSTATNFDSGRKLQEGAAN